MVTINFVLKHDSTQNDTFCIKDVNLNEDVKSLKKKLETTKDLNVQNYNLVLHGHILKDEDIVYESGLRAGSTVYGFPKYDQGVIPSAAPLSLVEVQQLLVSLRAAATNPSFRSFIQKLRSADQISRLVNECPPLKKDPASLAYVLDPDLLISLQNADNLSQVVNHRPAIGRILQIICNLLANESALPKRSRQVSYSLDALSDDEMEVESGENDTRSGVRRSSSFQPITPAQLAAALANATGAGSSGSRSGLSLSAPRSGLTTPSSVTTPFNTPAPPSGSGAGGGASPGGIITSEMFSQALQNALAASATRNSELLSGSSSATASSIENVEESLQLMREMGIPDEELSLQALQATNGDVQAAVNLIFAQWMADD